MSVFNINLNSDWLFGVHLLVVCDLLLNVVVLVRFVIDLNSANGTESKSVEGLCSISISFNKF